MAATTLASARWSVSADPSAPDAGSATVDSLDPAVVALLTVNSLGVALDSGDPVDMTVPLAEVSPGDYVDVGGTTLLVSAPGTAGGPVYYSWPVAYAGGPVVATGLVVISWRRLDGGWPELDAFRSYLGLEPGDDWDDANVADAYDAAVDEAVRRCGVDAVLGPDGPAAARGVLMLGSWHYSARNRGDGGITGAEHWRRHRALSLIRGGRPAVG